MVFSEEAIGITDQLLQLMINKMDDVHPFSQLLYETSLAVREILCCWQTRSLHHIAFEQLVARNFLIKTHLDHLSQNVVSPMESYLLKFSASVGQGWQKRWFSIHNHHMTFYRAKGELPHKALNLINQADVETVFKGAAEPEFLINAQNKVYKFKATTDRERNMWVEILKSYKRRRVINAHLISMSSNDKLKLFTEDIHTPQTPRNKQFLFSVIDREAPLPEDIDRSECKASFVASIPEKFGKGKDRKLDFKFDGEIRQLLITKFGEGEPYIVLAPSNLMDFKYTDGKLLLTISLNRNGKKNTKTFIFKPQSEFIRFKKAFESWRRFNNGFCFYHHKRLKHFRNLDETQIKKRSRKERSAHKKTSTKEKSQIRRTTASEVENLPPMSPSVARKKIDTIPTPTERMPSPSISTPLQRRMMSSRMGSASVSTPLDRKMMSQSQKAPVTMSKSQKAPLTMSQSQKAPSRRFPSPNRGAPPPTRGGPPPTRGGPPPTRGTPPPTRTGPPATRTGPPTRRIGPPATRTAPPARKSPRPIRNKPAPPSGPPAPPSGPPAPPAPTSSKVPKFKKQGGADRGSLLDQIHKGKKLKKASKQSAGRGNKSKFPHKQPTHTGKKKRKKKKKPPPPVSNVSPPQRNAPPEPPPKAFKHKKNF